MDQSELMQVRDTLDAVVQQVYEVDDVVDALELVESYIITNTTALAVPTEVSLNYGSDDTA